MGSKYWNDATIRKCFSRYQWYRYFGLPGHGLSEEPEEILEVPDFVEIVKGLLDYLNVTNPILIGHSFGGKISLLYASKYPVKKLVLLASAFKQEIKKISFKTKMLKQLKKVPGLNQLEEFAKNILVSWLS